MAKPVSASRTKTLLRKVGLKATPARLRILALLAERRDPLSAQTIIEVVHKDIDQATVYRMLTTLKEKGVIQQIDLRHNHAHYELASEDEHHHVICTSCGRIEDVSNCGVEGTHAMVLKHARHFATIQEHALEFYGMCKTCTAKGKSPRREN